MTVSTVVAGSRKGLSWQPSGENKLAIMAWQALCLEAAACDPGAPRWLSLASFLLSSICCTTTKEPSEAFVHNMTVMITLRAALVFSVFFHEYSHVLAAVLISGKLCALDGNNLLCNVPLSAWFMALVPFSGWPRLASNPHVLVPAYAIDPPNTKKSKLEETAIEYMGLFGSVVLCVVVTYGNMLYYQTPQHREPILACTLAPWLVAAGAFATDFFKLHPDSGSMYSTAHESYMLFRCGNFGMLLVSARNKLVDVSGTLGRMAATTAARGGQAGGLVTVLSDGSTVRSRYVPTKRADVAAGLVFRFASLIWLAEMWACLKRLFRCFSATCAAPHDNLPAFFLGHTRFATSSGPSVADTHPHRFSTSTHVNIWRCAPTGWYKSSENFELYVTHNGDLDYMEELDSKVLRTHKELGMWLQLVLHTASIPGCDSVKVAGVLELFRTQGIWKHALRLSSLLSTSLGSFGAQVLDSKTLSTAAEIADEVFLGFVGKDLRQDPSIILQLSVTLAAELYEKVQQLRNRYGTCEKLAELATQYFLENDLFMSVHKLLGKAHGSFGISACCSVDRDLVVLACRGQAMSLAFNEIHGVVLWGSEVSAQSVPFVKKGLQGTLTRGVTHGASDLESSSVADPASIEQLCTHRHDLDENGGEVVEVRVQNTVTIAKEMEQWVASGNVRDVFKCVVDDMGGYFAPFPMQNTLHLRVYKHKRGRFLSKNEFQQPESCVSLLPAKACAAVQVGPSMYDVVEKDMRDIPSILGTIRKEWDEKTSQNSMTSHALYGLLRDLILARNAVPKIADFHDRLEVDVLITGCEASLWIGEQFASDLQNLFPALRVVAMSANKVIGVLSNTRGSAPMSGFAFSSRTMSLKKTIILSLSHSGQTFPTLHATHTLRKLCGDRVFVVTGSVDSKMSAAVGQLSYVGAPWLARTWTTFAGWRPAEALTVSTVAFHQTLTELLLCLARCAVNETDAAFAAAAGLKLEEKDLDDMWRLNLASTQLAIPEILGVDAKGQTAPSKVHASLKKQGRTWALHVLEGPYSWCLSSAYICLTVIWGHPLFSSVVQLVYGALHDGVDGPQKLPEAINHVMLALDAVLYSFLPLFFCMLLRVVQSRELLARLGKRTLVIADVPYVHQLLESYVSKMFSLSYSIAALEVHGANAIDHLVHRFTHRCYRGTLIAVGRTDGRLFSQSKGESWILMAMQQCKAIMHLGSGPEIISVGHNPYNNPSLFTHHTTLSSRRPRFLCETLSELEHLETTEPMSLSAAVKELDRKTSTHTDAVQRFDIVAKNGTAASGGVATAPQNDSKAVGYHHLERLAPAQLLRMHLRLQRTLQRAGEALLFDEASRHGDLSRHELSQHSVHGLADRSRHSNYADRSRHSGNADRSRRASGGVLSIDRNGNSDADNTIHSITLQGLAEAAGPAVLDRAIDQLQGSPILQLFDKTATLELWHENRHASLERYVAFLVLFHQMAARVASFAPLGFNVSRSQSQLRVATTAAPISAAEIQHAWDSDFDELPDMAEERSTSRSG
mmetsp:Transcript_84638/g.137201  ORF Transcript_84638/g.137201 Transcript_84638/m.137201 type:complete len:1524 (+) Transcript_84638:3-4574(+)